MHGPEVIGRSSESKVGSPGFFPPNDRKKKLATESFFPASSRLMKIPYSLVTITVSACAAVTIVLAYGACTSPSGETSSAVTQTIGNRAVPIKNIAEFDQVFTAKLNQVISDSGSAAARGFFFIRKHIGPDWFTESCFRDARVAMSREELTKLRNQISAELKTATSRQVALSEVAKGQISAGFFVGTVHKIGKAVE